MNIQDIREIMGLTQAQVADELGVPKQEVVDCEENGETYLLLQYISAFPINPRILKEEDVDPFLPSFDQTTPGHRMRLWREEHGISLRDMALAIEMTPEELEQFEQAEDDHNLNRRRGEMIEKKTGINRKWLMYGDGREKGTPRLHSSSGVSSREGISRENRTPAPNKPAGQRIRQARENAGLTREQVAEMMGLSVSRIIQMESGYVKDAKADHVISRISSASDSHSKEDAREAGRRLREARKQAGLSVKEAAQIVQLKHTTLAHLESGYITSRHADKLIAMIRQAPLPEEKAPFDPKRAGLLIREERNKAGLSQKELSTILRLPITRVSLIELGNVTEKEAEAILRRIHGKPLREIQTRRVKPTEQVILGSNIRDARTAAGLSQKELGNMLNLPQTKISLMEKGKVDEPTAKKILQMLSSLSESQENPAQVTMAELLSPERESRRPRREVRPDLGQKVRSARIAAGMSQKQLAERMSLSQGSVSYLEQGKTDEAQAAEALRHIEEFQKEQ